MRFFQAADPGYSSVRDYYQDTNTLQSPPFSLPPNPTPSPFVPVLPGCGGYTVVLCHSGYGQDHFAGLLRLYDASSVALHSHERELYHAAECRRKTVQDGMAAPEAGTDAWGAKVRTNLILTV